MKRQSVYAMLLVISAGFARLAAATDLPPEVYAPETSINGVGKGWYLRGDLGYSGWSKPGNPNYTAISAGGVNLGNTTFDSTRFDDHFTFGGGVGYQFTDMIRADVTADMFNTDVTGSSKLGVNCAGQPAGTTCGVDHTSSLRGIEVLGNVYADLGTYSGITPYLGGGLGATHVQWDTMKSQPYCIAGAAACNATASPAVNNSGLDNWRFTYAIAAGMSYDITNTMKLDLGYRYTKVSGGESFTFNTTENGQGFNGVKGSDDGFSRHEIRAGIRVNTW